MSLRNSYLVAIPRFILVALILLGGVVSSCWTQLVGLYFFKEWSNSPQYLQAVMGLTRDHFLIFMIFISRIVSPTKVVITFDPTKFQNTNTFQSNNSKLVSNLLRNSVIISNHQIYTDWLFLWWISYTSFLSRSIYIVLKDLSGIPLIGWGMKNFKFLCLTRKWENDKVLLTQQLEEIEADSRGMGPASGVVQLSQGPIKWPQGTAKDTWPYQLIIFPEGTVTSDRTTKKSALFCKEKNINPPLKHVLVPRIRGLYLALKKLKTADVVYDFTIGYSNLKPTEYGEIKFSLKRFYIFGYGPKIINYYVREFKVSDIPLGKDVEDIDQADPQDLQKFELWLFKVWQEKDDKLKYFYEHGTFDNNTDKLEKTVIADLKLNNFWEIGLPFVTMGITILFAKVIIGLLYKFYSSILN